MRVRVNEFINLRLRLIMALQCVQLAFFKPDTRIGDHNVYHHDKEHAHLRPNVLDEVRKVATLVYQMLAREWPRDEPPP